MIVMVTYCYTSRHQKVYMGNIKTAISVREELFKQAECMARDMKLSRSRLFATALEEFIKRHQTRQLLDSINEAYREGPDDSERKYLRKMRRRHRKLIGRPW